MGTNMLTVSMAAAKSNMTEKALRQRIHRGQVPFRRWGRRILISAEEFDQFLTHLPGQTIEEARANVERLRQ